MAEPVDRGRMPRQRHIIEIAFISFVYTLRTFLLPPPRAYFIIAEWFIVHGFKFDLILIGTNMVDQLD